MKTPRCDKPLPRSAWGRIMKAPRECNLRVDHKGPHKWQDLTAMKVNSAAHYATNSGRKKATVAAWTQANSEKVKAYKAEYYATNSDRLKETHYTYRESPRGRATFKTWSESPEGRTAHKTHAHRRRATKLAATVDTFTAKELAAHIEAMGGRCVYCNGPYEHLDHVYPLSKGGPHALSNLVPACAPCNRRKSDMLPLHFLFPLQFTPK